MPPALRPLFSHNPLGAVIESLRAALGGQEIDWSAWTMALALSVAAFLLGGLFFNHSRDEFADVL